MNRLAGLFIALVVAMISISCKQYMEIKTQVSNGEIVFLLPQLPALGTLYVEELNTEKDAYQIAWSITFASDSAKNRTIQRIIYGKAPRDAKVDAISEAKPLRAGLLYTVGMDVGPIVAKGIFMLEKRGAETSVRNLTYQEAEAFRKASRRKY